MDDDNVVKFERRKPQPEKKPAAAQRLQAGHIWLAVLAVILLAWAYYQFIAPQTL
ncbi:hypothetical protein [Shinella oryzae]|uniref:hypothetical protein n=1 Tax=Shinella oryzae TaxID=2871820 RepID=UPI001FF6FAD4|nr:hypothetical protein [Shinella oryzae]UPA26447.1 hypothetical protein K6301_21030 [Shinella oryzae]